ncbi:MAG: polyprenol monophosphomannose synthase [Planctomycetes bacterium]|nr:polyprenol monophosphomannose synthase [Planctomycetota bacterium]
MQEGTSRIEKHPVARAAEPRILVDVATYNEGENIAKLIEEIHQFLPNAHILVVDDNSPDGTGKIVDEIAAKDPRVHTLHRPGKLGLGTAILAAMKYAMEHDYDLLLNMDADFSHPPRYLPNVIAGMAKNDVMIGSRYIAGGGSTHWPLSRRLISKSVNTVVRLLFRMQVHDASGGLRCYRVAKLRQTSLDNLWSRGYSFQQEVLYRCYLAGCKFGETPIIFENRKFGKSKVSLKESVRSLSTILYLGTRSMTGADKKAARAMRAK